MNDFNKNILQTLLYLTIQSKYVLNQPNFIEVLRRNTAEINDWYETLIFISVLSFMDNTIVDYTFFILY